MTTAIILAGGAGERMGVMTLPKQFIDVYGKPVIIHTLEAFDIHAEIDNIVVVCVESFIEDLRIYLRKFSIDKVKTIVPAGKTRQESSFNGLKAIESAADDDTIVVVHDAVRPLITGRIISDNIAGALKYGAVDTVLPAEDTIVKSLDGAFLSEIPIRRELFIGQTPQSFKYKILYEAHINSLKNNIENSTDDCRLAAENGIKVAFVWGDKFNIKITTQEDLTLLKALIKLGKAEKI